MLDDRSNTNISSDNGDSSDEQGEFVRCHPDKGHNKREKTNQQRFPNNSSITNTEEHPEEFLNMLVQACKRLCEHIKHVSLYVMNDLGGYQLFDRVAQWCLQHPHTSIGIIAFSFVALLPILLFFTFALSTIVMTLTGFLVFEGTLLTILTMIICGLLGALAVVILFFVLVGLATYFGVSHVYDMYSSTEVQRTVLRSFMQRDN